MKHKVNDYVFLCGIKEKVRIIKIEKNDTYIGQISENHVVSFCENDIIEKN